MDNSRDELGSSGQKEEFPQQEIDTSTIDYQVSTKPIPDSSISVYASPADAQKMEFEPSRNIEEVQEPILEYIHTTRSLKDTLT